MAWTGRVGTLIRRLPRGRRGSPERRAMGDGRPVFRRDGGRRAPVPDVAARPVALARRDDAGAEHLPAVVLGPAPAPGTRPGGADRLPLPGKVVDPAARADRVGVPAGAVPRLAGDPGLALSFLRDELRPMAGRAGPGSGGLIAVLDLLLGRVEAIRGRRRRGVADPGHGLGCAPVRPLGRTGGGPGAGCRTRQCSSWPGPARP
jgi:hypothetical protein